MLTSLYILSLLCYTHLARPQPWLNPFFYLICAIIHAEEWTKDKLSWLWASSEPICCLMTMLDFSIPFPGPHIWWLFCLFASNPQRTTTTLTLRWPFFWLHWENLNKQKGTSIDSRHHHRVPTESVRLTPRHNQKGVSMPRQPLLPLAD